MAFLSPGAFWWLLLLAVLLALYCLRRPVARRTVSSLWLWEPQDTSTARAALRTARPPWLLAVQAAFMMLAIVALAAPVLSCVPGGRTVIILDTSASLAARDGSATRFDRVRTAALDIVDAMPRGGTLALIVSGTPPSVVVAPTQDFAAVRAAIGAAVPAGASLLDPAVALARAIDPGADRYAALTDVSAPVTKTDARLEILRQGAAAQNVGITRLEARSHPGSALGGQALIEVSNFGSSEASIPLRISAGGGARADTLVLEAGARRALFVDLPDAGDLSAELDVDDSLPADDTARLSFARTPARVRLAGGLDPRVRAAFSVHPRVQLVGGGEVADLIACDSCDPTQASIVFHRATVPAGALAVIDPDHPLGAFVEFDSRTRIRALPVTGGDRVVLAAGGTPVVVASERRGFRVVHIGLDPAGVALESAWPVLIANAIAWTAPAAAPAATGVLSAEESDLRSRPGDETGDLTGKASAPGEASGWSIVLLLALAMLVTEWAWLAHGPGTGAGGPARS